MIPDLVVARLWNVVRGQGEAGTQPHEQSDIKRKVIEGNSLELMSGAWRKSEYKSWCSLKSHGVGLWGSQGQ